MQTLVGRATVCDVHETPFGNYVQVAFSGPGLETAPMPWLHVGKRSFITGDVIVAIRTHTWCGNVSQIKHYKEVDGQLEPLGACRFAKVNPLGV